MTFTELYSDVYDALVASAATIGVEPASIIKGGMPGTPPCINIIIEPKLPEIGERGRLRSSDCLVAVAFTTLGAESDYNTAVDAVDKGWKIIDALDACSAQLRIIGIEFVDLFAGHTTLAVEFESSFSKS